MPTGYTAIIDDHDATFEQFLWRCTRAFGATIMQRDESLGARVALTREPSTYYTEQREKAEAKLRDLETLTADECARRATVEYAEREAAEMEYRANNAAKRARYDAMAAKVAAWKPPTKEHAALKRFMLEQLDTGKPYESGMEMPTRLSPDEWRKAAMARARRDVAYYRDEERKEAERCREATEWLQALHAAVPQPEPLP